jgi:sugar phosphate isomerase/epimerase
MKTASPLFILRRQCETGLFTVLERLKDIGFDGVEFLGFFGHDPEAVGRKMKELKLEPLGNHVDYLTFSANPLGVIAAHKAAGCRYITIGGDFNTLPVAARLPEQVEAFSSSRFSEWVDTVTRIGQMCRNEGITLLFHNHQNELMQRVDGKRLLTHLMDSVPPEALSLEPDLGWMAIAGASPLEYLSRYKDRSPVLHLKDYYASLPAGTAIPGDVAALGNHRGTPEQGHFEFRPTGYGIMNYPALMEPMLACKPEWIVLDHDLAYERDPFMDLLLSLDYVKALIGMQQ